MPVAKKCRKKGPNKTNRESHSLNPRFRLAIKSKGAKKKKNTNKATKKQSHPFEHQLKHAACG